ncbi:MAG TPA: winged helix-turn-helix domain-containing protein [Pyrinomonadaceae bacterium]|nr:winged helix-turn-helix domain-containing protein [Pyrinomonadaceae bacterium]
MKSCATVYLFGPFRLDEAEVLLLRHDQPVPLKPKAFQLLLTLLQHAGHMLTKEHLMQEVWPHSFVEEHNLAVHISDLRKALGGAHPYIQTVSRHGYRFTAKVLCMPPQEPTKSSSNGPLIKYRVNSDQAARVLAVQPVMTKGFDCDIESLSKGLVDALLAKLSPVRTIAVRPAGESSGVPHDQNRPAVSIELQNDFVLRSSLERVAGQTRVVLQVLDMASKATVLNELYDEDSLDISQLQESISQKVAYALGHKLNENTDVSSSERLKNSEAFVAYRKGLFLLNKRLIADLNRSIEYYQTAIALDPTYALAYVGIGRALISSFSHGLLTPEVTFSRARQAILQALEIERDLAEAHAVMGQIRLLHDWDWVGAEQQLQQAIDLNPECAVAHETYAIYLATGGRFSEALKINQIARMLDPASLTANLTTARIQFLSRDYNGALDEIAKVLELEVNYPAPYYFLGLINDELARHDRANLAYQRYNRLLPDNPEILANMCRSYALAGRISEAKNLLDHLTNLAKLRYIPPYYLAYCHAGLGNIAESLTWLERALMDRDPNMVSMKIDPRIDRLKGEPRFIQAAKRVFLTWPE